MKKHIFSLCIVIIVSFIGVLPFVNPGYFPMHDDTQVSRVIVMGKALREGQFPVRWVTDLGYGYGYPIFNFYGPLSYYFGGSLYALGVDAIVATKSMFLIGALLAPICMYIAVAPFMGSIPAVIASVFYMYAPYHAIQMYVRGSVGEYWAYAFLPLIFYGLWGLKQKNYSRYVLIGGLGLSAVIVSHTIAGFIVICGLCVYMSLIIIFSIMKRRDIRNMKPLMMLMAVGLGLSAFYWLPAFLEKKFTSVEGMLWDATDYRDQFVCLPQLWNSAWGFGGSVKGCIDGMSFKLGKIHIVAALAGIVVWAFVRKNGNRPILVSGILMSIISVFMMLPYSEWVWNIIPFSTYIQYPWRYLAFTVYGLSLLAAFGASMNNKVVALIFGLLIIFGVLYINAKLFVPQFTYMQTSGYYEHSDDLRYRASKISDEYLPPEIPRPENVSQSVHGTIVVGNDIQVDSEFESDTYGKYPIIAAHGSEIEIRKAYFPGFRYLVNGIEQKPIIRKGLPYLTIPEGRSVVEIFFGNTVIRTLANLLTVLTLLIILFRYGKKTIC